MLSQFYRQMATEVGRPARAEAGKGGTDIEVIPVALPPGALALGSIARHPRLMWVREHLYHLAEHTGALTAPAAHVAELRRLPWWASRGCSSERQPQEDSRALATRGPVHRLLRNVQDQMASGPTTVNQRHLKSDAGNWGGGMEHAYAAIVRPFVPAVVLTVLLGTSACGPLQHGGSDPLKFRSARHFLRTDRVKMKLDLERELADARAGPNGHKGLPPCYNLKQNINVEIQRMDSFAGGTVTDNIAAMQNDVTVMRVQRADFERDVNDFVNDGVARPKGEPTTIGAITGKINTAVAHANKTIRAIRGELSAAHALAARLATGGCASDAPPAAPAIPPVH